MTLKGPEIGLFTDGSAYHVDQSGGWAWIAFDTFDEEEFDFGGESETTNNRMELTAWIEGLKSLYRSLGPCDVLVYSDSQYVGLGAMDPGRKRKMNVDLWEDLDSAVARHSYVEFVWVKGHDDSYYNHFVDELAGEARKACQ